MKRLAQDPTHPLSRDVVWRVAVEACLGDDALDLESLSSRRRRTLGGPAMPMGMDDFFFDPDDPLREIDEDLEDEDES